MAYVERDDKLRVAADPLDVVDPHRRQVHLVLDDVRAGEALLAAGGGSRRSIAVMDTGLDVTHPEFAGRIARTYDTFSRGTDVTDTVGHGTFVTGLIAALDGNGIGGKGVAGNTQVFAIRGSKDGDFTTRELLRGIDFAIRRGADVLNMSLAGAQSTDTPRCTRPGAGVPQRRAAGRRVRQHRQLGQRAPVPGRGARRHQRGARDRPVGGRHQARRPAGRLLDPQPLREHRRAGSGRRLHQGRAVHAAGLHRHRVGHRPAQHLSIAVVPFGGSRFAYGQGTSFAAPIVSGIAALVWQVEPRLASEQVAEVLIRSARQTLGRGWNEFTGAGVVDGKAATDLAAPTT